MTGRLVRLYIAVGVAFAALALAPQAMASSCIVPSCAPINDSFSMSVIMGTLEVETSTGTVLYTTNDLYVTNGPIPDDLAAQIETDSVPAYIQDNIALLAGGNDFDFLTTVAPPMLLSVDGSTGASAGTCFSYLCAAVEDDLESISLGPVTSATSSFLYSDAYFISGLNSDQTEIADGVVNVNFAEDVVIETETSAVPEPKSALMIGCIVLGLALFRRMRAARLGPLLGCLAVLVIVSNCAPKAMASTCSEPSCTPVFNSFGIDVIMGTLEVETSGGTVVYTANDLLLSSGPIPEDLASQIQTDSGVPTYIQNNIGLLEGGSDFDFITEPAADFPPMLASVDGSIETPAGTCLSFLCSAVEDDLESISLGPATSATSTFLYSDAYFIEGFNSDQSELAEAAISVFFYDDVVVETETSAAPEPKSALILACVVLALALFRRVRASKLGRVVGCLAVLGFFSNCVPRTFADTLPPT
jgi:hypothetical protein